MVLSGLESGFECCSSDFWALQGLCGPTFVVDWHVGVGQARGVEVVVFEF